MLVIGVALLEPATDPSAEDDHLERVADTLEQGQIPPDYRQCLLDDLEGRLDLEQAPDGSRAQLRLQRDSAQRCARRLVAAGEYTPRQMMRLGRRIVPLGF